MSDLRTELTRIYASRKALTPQLVVDAARPPGSPLHDRFEWDDSVAGEEYRRYQASKLIRSVRYEYTPVDAPERKFVRGFVSVRQEGNREGYAPVEEIASDEFGSRLLLQELEREMAELKRKYGHLAEFIDIVRKAIA